MTVQVGSLESCKVLVTGGADITAADKLGRTPADLAKELGQVEMMRFLQAASK